MAEDKEFRFIRKYVLQVGSINESGAVSDSAKFESTALRIKANINNTKKGKTNKNQSTIEIYNLSPKSYDNLQIDDPLILRAGYESDKDIPVIFIGEITKIDITKQGQDTITKLTCNSAKTSRRDKTFTKEPVPDETSKDVAKYFADETGLPRGRLRVGRRVKYPDGYSNSGKLWPQMEEYLRSVDSRAYVDNGMLYIEPVTGVGSERGIKIKPEMVKDSIRPLTNDTTSKPKSKPGLKIVTFLDGQFTTSKTVQVTEGRYKGSYKIVAVSHVMDFEGSQWDTVLEVEGK
jgi:hypothetical protein